MLGRPQCFSIGWWQHPGLCTWASLASLITCQALWSHPNFPMSSSSSLRASAAENDWHYLSGARMLKVPHCTRWSCRQELLKSKCRSCLYWELEDGLEPEKRQGSSKDPRQKGVTQEDWQIFKQKCTPITENDPENEELEKKYKETNVNSELKFKISNDRQKDLTTKKCERGSALEEQ